MRRIFLFFCLAGLIGCGDRNVATAPVDNIKDNIDTRDELKKTVTDIGKNNADAVDKLSKENLKMK